MLFGEHGFNADLAVTCGAVLCSICERFADDRLDISDEFPAKAKVLDETDELFSGMRRRRRRIWERDVKAVAV
jgi:hypothetical protein